jgi:HD-like signal output (HDOD) protein
LLTQKIFEIEQGRKSLPAQPANLQQLSNLPDLPVMPETMLLMELQAGGRCPALREVSEIVLADVGATLQILRLAGREFPDPSDRPIRIEDCISLLGLEACLDAVSRQTIVKNVARAQISDFWNHSARIAALCALLADEIPDAGAGDAYLAGLLHELDRLPLLLGWPRSVQMRGNEDLLGLHLAQAWSLPPSVTDYFNECIRPASPGTWSGLVRKAHFIEGAQDCESSPDHSPETLHFTEPSILTTISSRSVSA